MEPQRITPTTLSEAQRSLVKQAVQETFLSLGVDVSSPEEIKAIQKDFAHMREWRETVESIERRSVWAILAAIGAGILAATILGIKAWINQIVGHH